VEIQGAVLLIRADTTGILIGMIVNLATRVALGNHGIHVIRVIGDRMLVITELREVSVATIAVLDETTDARHTVIVVRVETTEVRVVMIVARVVTIGVLGGTIDARHTVIVVRVETTEVRVAMTVALGVTIDEVTRVEVVRAKDVVAPVILAGTTAVRE